MPPLNIRGVPNGEGDRGRAVAIALEAIPRRNESKAARVQPWRSGVAVETVDAVSRKLGRGLENSWAGAENPKNECVADGCRRRHLFMSVFKMFILINRNRLLGQSGHPLVDESVRHLIGLKPDHTRAACAT